MEQRKPEAVSPGCRKNTLGASSGPCGTVLDQRPHAAVRRLRQADGTRRVDALAVSGGIGLVVAASPAQHGGRGQDGHRCAQQRSAHHGFTVSDRAGDNAAC